MDRKHTAIYQMSDRRNDDFSPGTSADSIGLVRISTKEIISLSKKHNAKQRLQRHVIRFSREC